MSELYFIVRIMETSKRDDGIREIGGRSGLREVAQREGHSYERVVCFISL